jgi:hypothetical protein
MKPDSQLNTVLNDEIGIKKSILKKFEPAGLICQIRNLGMRREQTNKKNPMLKEMKLR